MMRISSDVKNLVCRSCLERKPLQKGQTAVENKQQERKSASKDYFCKECKYNFKRARHLAVSACPYCSASGSLTVKGSTARIMADAFRIKGD